MQIPTYAIQEFEKTLKTDDWTSLFPALEKLCDTLVGHQLFSCSVFKMDGSEKGVAARIYSNDSENYPVSGLKDITPNRWTKEVIIKKKMFVANSVEGFSDVFSDYEFIASLGLGSVVNIPVFFKGEFVGTINLLHKKGYYTKRKLELLQYAVLPGLLSFKYSPESNIKV